MEKLCFGHLGLKSITSVIKTKTTEQTVLEHLDHYYEGRQNWNDKASLSAKAKIQLSLVKLIGM